MPNDGSSTVAGRRTPQCLARGGSCQKHVVPLHRRFSPLEHKTCTNVACSCHACDLWQRSDDVTLSAATQDRAAHACVHSIDELVAQCASRQQGFRTSWVICAALPRYRPLWDFAIFNTGNFRFVFLDRLSTVCCDLDT